MVHAILEIPALPPRSIVLDPPLSDEEFERLSEKTEFALVQRTSKGTIQVSELGGWMGSTANAAINFQLSTWNKVHGMGRVLMHCGFFLPDGSCLSAGSTYVTVEQWRGLSREDRSHFLRLAPAFVIELPPHSDGPTAMAAKMEAWIANGVELGWLIDPSSRQVHIYSPGATPRIETGSSVAGSGPVDGFVLDLDEVWRCYEL